MITAFINQVIFILINMLMARWHAHLIEQNRRIRHGWWAFGYGAFCTIFCWQARNWFLLVPILLLHKLVFAPFLNHFRHLPITYLSVKPASWLDHLEQTFFGRDWYRIMAFYMVVFIVAELLLLNASL